MSARRILMLGAPGAGKGTQAIRLADDMGVPHVSTGDMLRAAVSAETPVGRQAKAVMDSGRLVSDDLVIGIAEERLLEPDAKKGFILDGFPRTIVQAESLEALLDRLSSPLDCCLALEVETEALVARLLARAQLEGRDDDNEETIRERMRVYETQTAPLLDFYGSRKLVVPVNGMGEIPEVSGRIREALASR